MELQLSTRIAGWLCDAGVVHWTPRRTAVHGLRCEPNQFRLDRSFVPYHAAEPGEGLFAVWNVRWYLYDWRGAAALEPPTDRRWTYRCSGSHLPKLINHYRQPRS